MFQSLPEKIVANTTELTDYIPQMEPLIMDADAAAVSAYMSSGGWLTEFKETRLLEKSISEFTGARFCTMAPNGTLALFLALVGCGIGRDDEVIVPALTMAATASSVILAGGNVAFGDVDESSLCLDLDRAERLISTRTKAVIVVSLNGRTPTGLEDFAERCRRRGIKVVEDAAQSLGSYARGAHLGTIGDCGCFSFSTHKVVTTGQGGAVVTDDESIFRKMCLLRDFGRLGGGADHYGSLGWNLKFTDLQAVIGLEQMRRLPQLIARKRRIFELYREELSDIEGIEIPDTDLTGTTPLFADILVDPESKFPLMRHLHANGVGSRSFYPALHLEPAFETSASLPVAERASTRGLWLPSSMGLAPEQITKVCHLVRKFLAP